ncbi:MAG TPA: lysoplasmalogenase [Candidatus Hydrogenedentes bacterium]|nr:lysoplasmalogenase [Candidatus Hydrogenedentota bacterium]
MGVIYVALGMTVAAVGLLLWFLSHEHYLYGFFKMLASTGFIFLCISSGGIHSAYGLIILVGLVLSWWGDLFLISRGAGIFMLGLVSFFLAHICYIAAFIVYGTDLSSALIALAALIVPCAFIVRWLHPHLGKMRIAVYAYMCVITLMAALSVSAAAAHGGLLIPLGAILFFCSDIFVARDRFVRPGNINAYIGLPLYYSGQVLLAMTPLYVQ